MGGKLEVYTAEGRLKTDSGAESAVADHIADTADAHDASAVSVLDTGGLITATDVEAALAELATEGAGTSTVLGGGSFRRSIILGNQVWSYIEFTGINVGIAANAIGNAGGDWLFKTQGTGSNINQTVTAVDAATLLQAEHPGIAVCDTGTTNTGIAGVYAGFVQGSQTIQAPLVFGTGKTRMGCWVRWEDASSAAGGQQFTIRAGFGDRAELAQSNGAYFRVKDDVNSGKWEFVKEVATVETAADTGVAGAADTWFYLEVEVSAAGVAEFFINGSSVGSVSGIATGAANAVFPFVRIEKTVGTTRRTLYIDAVYYMQAVNR